MFQQPTPVIGMRVTVLIWPEWVDAVVTYVSYGGRTMRVKSEDREWTFRLDVNGWRESSGGAAAVLLKD